MKKNDLGELRQSQVLQTGPGAIIDFRANTGATVSAVPLGLEEWETTISELPMADDPQIIREHNLQKSLGKKFFRLPPVQSSTGKAPPQFAKKDPDRNYLGATLFPNWLICPMCETLDTSRNWDNEIGQPSRFCPKCSNGANKVYTVPTRFILTCENGHLSDFPWQDYLKATNNGALCDGECSLELKNFGGFGLGSLFLICQKCKAQTSMAGALSPDNPIISNFTCRGERPWLGDNEECKCKPRAIQRGASNNYFPVVVSALSIPPWDDRLQQVLETEMPWEEIVSNANNEAIINFVARTLEDKVGISRDDAMKVIKDRIEFATQHEQTDIREQEYRSFSQNVAYKGKSFGEREFKTKRMAIPEEMERYFSALVKVDRLREVRVQTGFTRITPPMSMKPEENDNFQSLSRTALDWLPAAVIRGEGIFFELNGNSIQEWLREFPRAAQRAELLINSYRQELQDRDLSFDDSPLQPDAKFILLHSLSHILIRQFAISSGYNAAAIRERIYGMRSASNMCGVLIYTGASDSDGTLGGLSRLSNSEYFGRQVKEALRNAQWCSSDPLCSEGISSASETLNNAACQSCSLLPETSCEHFNKLLDRALLVGTPEQPEIGYFSKLLEAI